MDWRRSRVSSSAGCLSVVARGVVEAWRVVRVLDPDPGADGFARLERGLDPNLRGGWSVTRAFPFIPAAATLKLGLARGDPATGFPAPTVADQ